MSPKPFTKIVTEITARDRGCSQNQTRDLREITIIEADPDKKTVMQQVTKQSSGLSAWLAQLTSRTHRNVAAVALANKLARIAWAVLAKNEPYRPPVLANAAAALATTAETIISYQVCWRTRRWHNGRTRRSPNPDSGKVFRD
jgi:hypothetical protein